MNVASIIAAKRDGKSLSRAELAMLVDGFTRGEVPDYQMSAFCMAVFFQGMTAEETATLTELMLVSGDVLLWPESTRPKVDKHSTGGIGDKTSIILAPALACLGADVPMISGHGLGPTGGTLDKLDSIPGFRGELSNSQIKQVIADVGCVIAGATETIAPADLRLYRLRDVTATVPSIPLITASILSKKLAEGLDALVLDVKWGSGAFMKTLDQARQLAQSLVEVADLLGCNARAIITDMNRPLGRMIGNAVEIDECVTALKTGQPEDVMDLTVELGAQLLAMTGLATNLAEGQSAVRGVLRDGSTLDRLKRLVASQGGDLDAPRYVAPVRPLAATKSGYVTAIDCEKLGHALIQMGGGRRQIGDSIDHGCGVEMLVDLGQSVEAGQPMINVFLDKPLDGSLCSLLCSAMAIGDRCQAPPQRVVETR